MFDATTEKVHLTLTYEKLLQKYQVLLATRYTIILGFIGLYFTLSQTIHTTLAIIFGVAFLLADRELNDVEDGMTFIIGSLMDLEKKSTKGT